MRWPALNPLFDRLVVRRLACFVVVAGFGWVTAAQGSIMLPAVPEFELASQSKSNADETEFIPDGSPTDPSQDECPQLGQDATALQTRGTSTSTSPSGTGPGGSTMAIGILVANLSDDPDVGGWVSGEACLNLPASPGNELLRPPQA